VNVLEVLNVELPVASVQYGIGTPPFCACVAFTTKVTVLGEH